MRRLRVADEVKYFGRSAIFAVVVGAIYWVVSYEWVGTVLLIAFGLAAAFATTILFAGSREVPPGSPESDETLDRRPDGPFGDESGRLPAPTLAPLFVGLGLGIAAMSLAFGVWFLLLGLVVILPGGVAWLAAAGRELRAMSAEDD
jgi:hypothetical protein